MPDMNNVNTAPDVAAENAGAPVENTEKKEVARDESMDVSALLKASKEEAPVEESPLEKAKKAKESGQGMVVENTELKDDSQKKVVANKSIHDGIGHIDAYMQEQDQLINAAKDVKLTRPPKDASEMVAIMDQLEDKSKGKTPTVAEGEESFLVDKTDEEKAAPVTGANIDENAATPTEDGEEAVEEMSESKRQVVEILIDKTGLGGDFQFTDEEKEKIFAANEIKLKEIEEIDLSSITVRKADKSFIDSVNEFQLASSKVPVTFPASRFKAYMTGLSYGEMGDIALNNENVTFDQIHKKLTVIYNKMINPSIGKFESFEDFLKKFSYVDIDIAVYGLCVATFPEVDDIPLTCNNHKCGKGFNHKFSPRSLIRFEKSSEAFLNKFKDVVECPATGAMALADQSPTRLHKRYKLPYSDYVIEVGIASAYDYLYDIVDNMIGDNFSQKYPNDVNGILQLNSALLGLIRKVYVPDGSGSYVEYDKFDDMIHALYMVKPEEIAILSSMLTKYTEEYQTSFELTNIVCPHCGTKTASIPLDVNYLVFLKYQRLMNTEINVDNISVL